MMDLISFVWTVLKDFGLANWWIVPIVIVVVGVILLVKEYGKNFLERLMHRRNRLSLCTVLFFSVVLIVLFLTGVAESFPFLLKCLLILLYCLYIGTVLRSVKSATGFSKHYLDKYRRWLRLDQTREHSDILSKRPWYFLDANEKISYQILKSKYLFELGNHKEAYETLSDINHKLLYPEEIDEVNIDLIFMLLELGNIPKAENLTEAIKTTSPVAFGFFKSHLSELQGDLDSAWTFARAGSDAADVRKDGPHILSALYTQLGRLSFFRKNLSDTFYYYRLALEQAKKYGDIRGLHPVYQNYLSQIQMNQMHEEEWQPMMQEYMAAAANSSIQNILEVENIQIAMARQRGDREEEFKQIITGYRKLHEMTVPPDQYIIEVSTLWMLNNGQFDPSEVLKDITQHFDEFFSLPFPARFIALQDMTIPHALTEEQAALYEKWGEMLMNYAKTQAMQDLDQYERILPPDCINERCWILLQRVDFTRRASRDYDGERVLSWLRDAEKIYQDYGQSFQRLSTRVSIIKQYDEMIALGKTTPDVAVPIMRKLMEEAREMSNQLPNHRLGGLLIEMADLCYRLGGPEIALEFLRRFQSSNQSIQHFSYEIQMKAENLKEVFRKAGVVV